MNEIAMENARNLLRPLALAAIGRTGADIERLVREVRQRARCERRTMTWADIEMALEGSRRPMTAEFKWRTAVHEAGHALAWSLSGIATVRTVALGIGGPGFVEAELQRGVSQTEVWLTNTIVCLLAGRAAERLMFAEVSSGSGGADESDLAKATELALDVETRLGFSSVRPLLYCPQAQQASALTLDRQLAARVHDRLEAAEQSAFELLAKHREILLRLAERLAAAGVIEGDEVRALIGVAAGEGG